MGRAIYGSPSRTGRNWTGSSATQRGFSAGVLATHDKQHVTDWLQRACLGVMPVQSLVGDYALVLWLLLAVLQRLHRVAALFSSAAIALRM